jgi:hypothetical protein
MSFALESFARQSLSQFTTIYAELFDGRPIQPSELEALMWGRICAKDANINKLGFKINYENIKRSKVTLPYMPDDINYSGCPCIKKNGGLYTPCCGKLGEDAEYCKSCSVDKEGNEKPLEFGVIDDREENIESGNFTPLTYGEWMRAKKTSLPEVYKKLAEAGIQLEIPARELICRAVTKNRKGRPAKDADPEDEDAPVKPRKSPKASPKSSPKSSPPASESDSEPEVPTPPKAPKKASKAGSGDDEPKKASKAKKAGSGDDEPKAKGKAKKAGSGDEAKSGDDEPKAKGKAKKAGSGDEPKSKKASKAKAGSGDDEPKAKKATKSDKGKKASAPEEPAEEEAEQDELEENEEEECEVDQRDYILRNKKYICDKDDGTILGTLVEGRVTWSGDRR